MTTSFYPKHDVFEILKVFIDLEEATLENFLQISIQGKEEIEQISEKRWEQF